MTDEEREFAEQGAYLQMVHGLADRAEELAGDDAVTLLFAATLAALNRLGDAHYAIGIAIAWAESLKVQTVTLEATH